LTKKKCLLNVSSRNVQKPQIASAVFSLLCNNKSQSELKSICVCHV
jgi:hypothetical protein